MSLNIAHPHTYTYLQSYTSSPPCLYILTCTHAHPHAPGLRDKELRSPVKTFLATYFVVWIGYPILWLLEEFRVLDHLVFFPLSPSLLFSLSYSRSRTLLLVLSVLFSLFRSLSLSCSFFCVSLFVFLSRSLSFFLFLTLQRCSLLKSRHIYSLSLPASLSLSHSESFSFSRSLSRSCALLFHISCFRVLSSFARCLFPHRLLSLSRV